MQAARRAWETRCGHRRREPDTVYGDDLIRVIEQAINAFPLSPEPKDTIGAGLIRLSSNGHNLEAAELRKTLHILARDAVIEGVGIAFKNDAHFIHLAKELLSGFLGQIDEETMNEKAQELEGAMGEALQEHMEKIALRRNGQLRNG